MTLKEFFELAEQEVITQGFQQEIDLVEKRTFNDQTSGDFFREYVYVVCNSGMKNKVAEKIFQDYMWKGIQAIKHSLKRKAILEAEKHFEEWFETLKVRVKHHRELEFLESLPHIGKITKYHLARNLGLDVAKPDRHLSRLADHFGFSDANHLCIGIYSLIEGRCRVGTIDVILWRYCTLYRDYMGIIEKESK